MYSLIRYGRWGIAFLLVGCGVAWADVRVPALFGDNGVLQAQKEIPVWGEAAPGEKVTVSLDGAEAAAVAGADGRWQVCLPARAAGGPFELVVKGSNEVRVRNMMVGEVWICSGQSNMTLPLSATADAEAEIARVQFPNLRLFNACRNVAEEPLRENGGAWAVCTPQSAARFSGVAYYFGKSLLTNLNVAVGLVHASWPGVPGESWVPMAAQKGDPALANHLASWADKCENNESDIEAYEPKFQAWRKESEAAMRAGKTFPEQPDAPEGPRHQYYPANCYNGMIAPLMPFAARGVIWYQGEGNRDRAGQYDKLLAALIGAWRAGWRQPDLPFGIVQLANSGKPAGHAGGSMAAIREAQRRAAASIANAGLIVTCDIGDAADVHAKNKRDVGGRLALWARATVYGQKIEYAGPTFAALEVKDGRAVVRFTHAEGGLVARGGALQGFSLAGADGRFVEAAAVIEGDTVVLTAPGVPAPAAVDYSGSKSRNLRVEVGGWEARGERRTRGFSDLRRE